MTEISSLKPKAGHYYVRADGKVAGPMQVCPVFAGHASLKSLFDPKYGVSYPEDSAGVMLPIAEDSKLLISLGDDVNYIIERMLGVLKDREL